MRKERKPRQRTDKTASARKWHAEQREHPKWQRRRLEIMDKADFACERCGDDETQLHVHHKYYVWDNELWDYPDEALECLCRKCHQAVEDAKVESKSLDEEIRRLTKLLAPDYTNQIVGYLRGMACLYLNRDEVIPAPDHEAVSGLAGVIATPALNNNIDEMVRILTSDGHQDSFDAEEFRNLADKMRRP